MSEAVEAERDEGSRWKSSGFGESGDAVEDVLPIDDVTVVVPVYNHADWLWTCLSSIRRDSREVAIVVVNDGSTDRSGEVAEAFAQAHPDQRVHVVHRTNGGLCAALNSGLSVVRTRFVRFVDADDEFVEGSTATLLAILLASEPDVVAVYGDLLEVDEAGRPYWWRRCAPRDGREGSFRDALLRRQPHVYVQQTIYRTDAIEALGGFDEELSYQDVDLHLRLLRRWRMRHVGVPAFRYRQLPNSMSTSSHVDEANLQSRRRAFLKHQGTKEWRMIGPEVSDLVDAASWRTIAAYAFDAGDVQRVREAAREALRLGPPKPRLLLHFSLSFLGERALRRLVLPVRQRYLRAAGRMVLRMRWPAHAHGALEEDSSDSEEDVSTHG